MDTVDTLSVMPIARKDGTHVLRLCVNQGLLTPDMVRKIMDVMTKYALPSLRATTGQRFNLEGIPSDKVDEIAAALGTPVDKCPPGVSVCPGGDQCKYGMQDTRAMGDALLDLIKANGPYPFKIKSGVSGCAMACGLSFVRDVGLVGGAKGWNVYYGGAANRHACTGIVLGKKVSKAEALESIAKGLTYYKENAKKFERIGAMVRRLGRDVVAAALTE
ncbi:nitrite reductase [Pseudodesulfovibrio sediminis]|uniref:Sulfite reductase, assimilatory-type n=1 Tax=Pseudodesulfovibrio sediminis TaxID=2810563 RepID=A0ABM7P8X1_9BACT|nr:nitrite reductase [Pseudodesulfovibrio sediminis]BCS89488.1 sulfite reductase, assimilatory-type [Pseudodesulfovibrio sediminis]